MSFVELALADQPLADAQQHAHQGELGIEHARLPLLGCVVGWTFREPDGQLVLVVGLARVSHAGSVRRHSASQCDSSGQFSSHL